MRSHFFKNCTEKLTRQIKKNDIFKENKDLKGCIDWRITLKYSVLPTMVLLKITVSQKSD